MWLCGEEMEVKVFPIEMVASKYATLGTYELALAGFADPNIKFTLINNDKVIFKTDGNGDLLKVVYEIYGVDITKKMIPINGENDD